MNGKKLVNARFLHTEGGELYFDDAPIYTYDGIVVEKDSAVCDFQEYNMRGMIVMPALFNLHSHLGESMYRDISGSDWTIDRYLQYTNKINEDMDPMERRRCWESSARFTIDEMKKYGTVGFCAARSAEISKEMGILTMSGYPIMNNIKLIDYKTAGREGFEKYDKMNRSDSCSIGVFLHSVYANDQESLRLAAMCMEAGAEFISTHVSEDYSTRILECEMHGMTAVEVLDENGLLSEKSILVHCGYASESDLNLIKDRGAVICICPISNAFLNTRMIDINALNKLGIPWMIGTDGLATGRTFSLRRQVNMAKENNTDVAYKDFWMSITTRPGKLFRRKIYTGSIDIGSKTDFIVFDSMENDVERVMADFFTANGTNIQFITI